MTAANFIIIFNLFILESLLSIDNAAVLAVMVKKLPESQRPKALKYGIWGAFFFRGLALLLATWLVKVLWLKIAGGVYLLYLAYGHFTPAKDTLEEGVDETSTGFAGLMYSMSQKIKGWVGVFWSTVFLVEMMDMAFSIDNIFAAVAMTDNIYLIMLGVFIGIVSMRFVAQWFSKLIQKFPTLETSAFIVIALLGVKLVVSGTLDYVTGFDVIKSVINSHHFDFGFSACMMLIFFLPMLKRK